MHHDPQDERALLWFRRDLRFVDNAALFNALTRSRSVWCAFVFDTDILDALPSRQDRRVDFIHGSLVELDGILREHGGGLIVRHGRAADVIPKLAAELGVDAVHANRDYEPQACARDQAVAAALAEDDRAFHLYKDQVVFERDEVMTAAGTPYTVFTPYKNAWLKRLRDSHVEAFAVEQHAGALRPPPAGSIPSLEKIGFAATDLRRLGIHPGAAAAAALLEDFLERIDDYGRARDFPAIKGPSYLSVHLRFGTLSIRRLAAEALRRGGRGAEVWLSELIWRDFYFQILHHHPRVVERAFKSDYDAVRWDNDQHRIAAWKEGRTGYPLVDAAMRQINATGYMHNRLRMVAASFLVKDLHVDWRVGEGYFANQLNDFDLSANNGGWQWAASTGCDAQPYFRIFNPVTQSGKFDPDGKFIRRYLPELAKVPLKRLHAPWTMSPEEQQASGCLIGRDYPAPVVDHDQARRITLERFQAARGPK